MRRLIPRKFERRSALGDAIVRPLTGAALPASVLNLAQGGAALFVKQALAIGSPVEISFPIQHGSPDDPQTLVARVVRSRADDSGNVVGVAFVRPLTSNEFRLLEQRWRRA